MDQNDKHILSILHKDARSSHANIGDQVGLAASSVTERIKKLVAKGHLKNWTINIDYEAYGLGVLAFVHVFVSRETRNGIFIGQIADLSQVLECHHVTGEWTYLLKVRAESIKALEEFMLSSLQAIQGVEKTHTIIALSSSKG